MALVESVCRTVLRRLGEPARGGSELAVIAASTLEALHLVPAGADDERDDVALIAMLRVVRDFHESERGRDGVRLARAARHARLAIGAAVTFAGFIVETYLERAAS